MVPAVFDQTTVDIVGKADRSYNFRVTGSVMKFDGFLRSTRKPKRRRMTKTRSSRTVFPRSKMDRRCR